MADILTLAELADYSEADWRLYIGKNVASPDLYVLLNKLVNTVTAQSITALKTFDKDKLAMKGTSTGVNTISVANTGASDYSNEIPAKSGTFAMTSDITINDVDAGTNITIDKTDPLNPIINATGGGGAATALGQGTAYTFLGELLNESFSGVTLSATNWSDSLPPGASVNSSLIIASGSAAWDRYITLAKHYLYEKQDIIVDMVATTKAASDGWGWHQSSILASYNESYYWKFNQETGILSLGTTTAANEIGEMQPIDFTAGDNLKFTWKRQPGQTVVTIENITDSSKLTAIGTFPVSKWGTNGYYRLTLLGGQQVFNNITIDSTVRDYGTNTEGVVFVGDSIGDGEGASSVVNRYTNLLMKNQTTQFENLCSNSWLSSTLTAARLTDILGSINAKYLVCNMGYNDKAQSITTGAYTTSLELIATTAQGLGYEVVFVSPWPDRTSTNAAYVTAMETAATNTSSIFIDISGNVGVIADDTYLEDGVHPDDSGHALIADSIELQGNEFFENLFSNIDNEDIQFRDLGFSKEILPILGLDSKGRGVWLDPSKYVNKNTPILQQNLLSNGQLYKIQSGSMGVDGSFVFGNSAQQLNATAQGLRLGFNNGVADAVGSNINITNIGSQGAGYPQYFNDITGLRNIVIQGVSLKTNSSGAISGNDNFLVNSNVVNAGDVAGNKNIAIFAQIESLTTGLENIGIGAGALRSISTGRNNIMLSNLMDYNGGAVSFNSAATGVIVIGTPHDYTTNEAYTNGEVCIASYTRGARIYTFGPKGALSGAVTWRSGIQTGTNENGKLHYIDAFQGTGSGTSGDLIIRTGLVGTTGSTPHVMTEQLRVSDGSVTIANILKLGQFTATEASALTPSDADMIYVTSTNGTFTSIGFWGYENAAWVKL